MSEQEALIRELSSNLEFMQAENETMTRVLSKTDQQAAMVAEIKRLERQVIVLNERVFALMEEKQEAVALANRLKARLAK